MIVRPPWSPALELVWHRPRLARQIQGERAHEAVERHLHAHLVMARRPDKHTYEEHVAAHVALYNAQVGSRRRWERE